MRVRRFVTIGLSICIIFSSVLALLYKINIEKIIPVTGLQINNNTQEEYEFYIDNAYIENGRVYINGWSVKKGEDYNNPNVKIILQDTNEKMFSVHTTSVRRTEVTTYFNDGFNYDNSGIFGSCKVKYLEPGMTYKVLILMKDGNKNSVLMETSSILINK